MIELALMPIGLLIAAFFSMVGLAGGSFIVPMLVLGLGVVTQKAIGISLLAVMATAVSATIAYAIQRKINFKVGLLLDTLDVPGAFIGAYFTTLIASTWLAGMFGGLLVAIAFYMLWKKNFRNKNDSGVSIPMCRRTIGYCMFGSLASGIVSAMFGIGGGVIDEVVMILMLGMTIHVSAGTAMFGMAITTVAAFVPHLLLGNIIWDYAIPLAIGCAIGGQIGPHLSKHTRASTLKKILAAAFTIIGLRMFLIPFIGS